MQYDGRIYYASTGDYSGISCDAAAQYIHADTIRMRKAAYVEQLEAEIEAWERQQAVPEWLTALREYRSLHAAH